MARSLLDDFPGSLEPLHFALNGRDQVEGVDRQAVNGLRGNDLVEFVLGVRREEMCDGHGAGKTVLQDRQGCHHVEPEKRQVRQVFLVQRLILEMGVDETDAPEPFGAKTVFREVGDEDVMVRTDQDVPDSARTVDDETYLAADHGGSLGQGTGSLGRNDRVGRHLSPVEPFERLDLSGFEASCIAVNGRDRWLLDAYFIMRKPVSDGD